MNWLEFLTTYKIGYVTSGPNTRRGEVSIKCPFCGEDDPSEHLGVALDKEAWGCHRNSGHRGKAPFRLVQALLGCSFNQAQLIVGQYNQADPESLDDALKLLGEEENEQHKEEKPSLAGFKQIKKGGSTARFYDYLFRRGFETPSIFSSIYYLSAATSGRYKDRIIIPTFRDCKLVAFTGRAITPVTNAPRYLSSSQAIKTTIFNEDNVMAGGDILFVTEGPFDALKVDNYGFELGARATCIFGATITIDQMAILKQASSMYRRVVLLLDHDAIEQTFMISDWLPGAEIGHLPFGVKDPGDLTKEQVQTLARDYL